MEKFPCLGLAYEAAEAGGAKTVALNAADEVAVAAFLQGRIAFNDIPEVIREVSLQRKMSSYLLKNSPWKLILLARELALTIIERAEETQDRPACGFSVAMPVE